MTWGDGVKAKLEASEAKARAKSDASRARLQERKGKPVLSETPAYDIEVIENLATSGFNTTKGMKYRWVIKRNGEPFKTGYGFTYTSSYQVAKAKVEREEKKRLRKLDKNGE
jgi:hypothetical protein